MKQRTRSLKVISAGFIFAAVMAIPAPWVRSQTGASGTPSLILGNGKIITVDVNFSKAQAVADFMSIPDDDIGKLQPQLTMVGGKIFFVHTDFSKEYNLKPEGAVVSTYPDLLKRRNRMRGVSQGG